MSFFPSLTPPPPPFLTTANGGMSVTTQQQQTYYDNNNSNVNAGLTTSSTSSSTSFTSSIVIMSIVISSAIIISASIYILLRFLSRRSPTNDIINISASSSESRHIHNESAFTALNSLPLFTFGSVNGNLTGKDCAVCLSKFEKEDQLRLLPLCCHAFHAQCIDAWLMSNQTCPLCRSTVYPTDADVINKVLSVMDNNNINNNNNNNTNSGNGSSFSIEIGSISQFVDDGYEIPLDSVHQRGVSEITDKEEIMEAPPGEVGGSGTGSGRNWLKEYVDRLTSLSVSSRALSFRSSGRFFSGSSRRSDVVVPVDEDLEDINNRAGEDISELFRWISGM